MSYIVSAKDARKAIGLCVWWEDRNSDRYYGATRSGTVEDVAGKNIMINGDWKWRPYLNNLRTTEEK